MNETRKEQMDKARSEGWAAGYYNLTRINPYKDDAFLAESWMKGFHIGTRDANMGLNSRDLS